MDKLVTNSNDEPLYDNLKYFTNVLCCLVIGALAKVETRPIIHVPNGISIFCHVEEYFIGTCIT